MKGKLILENGISFEGKIFGELKESVGEVVFNTSMVGYQEILTDPAYKGKIVVMTYPMIGNYGINLEDMESKNIHLNGFVIKEDAKLPNNFRCEMTLEGFLKQHGVVGFKGIDTRELTRIIRDNGTMKAIITTDDLTEKEMKEYFDKYSEKELTKEVSTKEIINIEGTGKKVGIIDLGVKNNNINSFVKRGCNVTIFPYDTKAEEILKYNLDGLFLSNGAENPDCLEVVSEEIKKLIGKLPIFAVGLGHLLVAKALGGTTKKLKYGHRGSSVPVKNILADRVVLVSENQGYCVDTLPENITVTHRNLNDNTIAGFEIKDKKITSYQFQVDSWPGAENIEKIFDEFVRLIG